MGAMPDLSPAPSHKKVIATALGASVALHLIVAGALLVKLPVPSEAAPEEEIVQVEIVPPPEEEQPEPVEEAKKPDALKLEEAAKAEEPPPEKPPEQKPQEDPLEDPVISASKASAPEAAPPPSPAQDEKPEEPPKPEEPQPEEPKPEEPKPEEPRPEEKPPEEAKEPEAPQKAEEPTPPPPPASPAPAEEEKQALAPPMSTLRPVFQFGEKDSGPRQALDGNAAEDSAAPAETDAPETDEPVEAAGQDGQGDEAPPETPMPTNMTPPQLGVLGTDPSALPGPAAGTSPDAMGAGMFAGPPSSAPVPTQKPAPPKPSDAARDLKPVRTLFSARDTGDTLATVAMAGIPRGVRAGQLCSSELSAQLQNGSPAYRPDVLPAPKLPEGTVLNARNIGFRSGGQWHDVSFRCEVDADATKIVSFSMNVGGLVPRSEWRKRGFPEF
jgi:hypothetical protein